MFQFPSNGKAYLNGNGGMPGVKIKKFQFPSNGKAYLNRYPSLLKQELKRFQFPSNGKAYLNMPLVIQNNHATPCFNSLQTGKRI